MHLVSFVCLRAWTGPAGKGAGFGSTKGGGVPPPPPLRRGVGVPPPPPTAPQTVEHPSGSHIGWRPSCGFFSGEVSRECKIFLKRYKRYIFFPGCHASDSRDTCQHSRDTVPLFFMNVKKGLFPSELVGKVHTVPVRCAHVAGTRPKDPTCPICFERQGRTSGNLKK